MILCNMFTELEKIKWVAEFSEIMGEPEQHKKTGNDHGHNNIARI